MKTKIFVPILSKEFYVHFKTLRESIDFCPDVWDEDSTDIAATVVGPKGLHLFFLKEDLDSISPGTIAHECFHAMHRIFDASGISVEESEEMSAYTLGFIVQKVSDALDKMAKCTHQG